ncbi:MAG: hypothetical protein IKW03_02075 [Clostridia bacterium]|nr:hypothetical protein [Clostridia bacterium]
MECKTVKAEIKSPVVNAFTFPEGPRGIGIKEIRRINNVMIITFDDDRQQVLEMPDWWFGTRTEYNNLSESQKYEKEIYFIEEGT